MTLQSKLLPVLLAACPLALPAQTALETVKERLLNMPVQEKVYLHFDNNCYFKGDTIWYKAYVVRADNLSYTDMSRILYVELVSPDGLVVERQQVIVSADGYSNGNFALRDSLYSGFYELRAYTRWMMNFRVEEHAYSRRQREMFYSRALASDFFRNYGTVYSRVLPVYEKPQAAGDYSLKYLLGRPKRRLAQAAQERLNVSFFPEGGNLVAASRQRIAYEVTDGQGQGIAAKGTLWADGRQIATLSADEWGRGTVELGSVPEGRLEARFEYDGKVQSFTLPKPQEEGVSLMLSQTGGEACFSISRRGRRASSQMALAVLCRGVLETFLPITFDTGGDCKQSVPLASLTTGVNDAVVIDGEGNVLADRLFFVNNRDMNAAGISVDGLKDEYQPFEQVAVTLQCPDSLHVFSLSVRDASTDDKTYDTGNILTDLLLSSELKGYVAHPDRYFESDDEAHRMALDRLMLVQGWRRYDVQEAMRQKPLRYQPETCLTVDGTVYHTVNFDEIRQSEVGEWRKGIFMYSPETEMDEFAQVSTSGNLENADTEASAEATTHHQANDPAAWETRASFNSVSAVDSEYGISHGSLGKPVMVSGELVLGEEVADVEMLTDSVGRFSFAVPAFYGDGILFLSACKEGASERKKQRLVQKGWLDEGQWPEFYVKRNLFYPIFAKKYSYYQCHFPKEETAEGVENAETVKRISSMDTELQGVEVSARRRRGKRKIDYTKPAYVYDTYELYNLATDYGLSFGKLNFRLFPVQVSMLLLGNYGSYRNLNVDARMNDYLFYRNYSPESAETFASASRSEYAVFKDLVLKRQDKVRLFTDFELRNEDQYMPQSSTVADVTLDFVTLPNDTEQHTYRDRRIILHGITEPADFYSPDYSQRPLRDVADYRRTLYWNPNAKPQEDGTFRATFFTGSKPCRLKVDAAGIANGKFVVAE